MGRRLGASVAVLAATAALAAPSAAQQTDVSNRDAGGFRNVLPGGQGETVDAGAATADGDGGLPFTGLPLAALALLAVALVGGGVLLRRHAR